MTDLINKPLHYLLAEYGLDLKENPLIHGLAADSRQVQHGDLFFARHHADSEQHIAEAQLRGAAAIVSEDVCHQALSIPVITLPHLQQKIGDIAARFYDCPSKQLNIVGVTGTNGKTSCAYFIVQALHLLGKRTGLIGTLGNGIWPQLTPGIYTTPDAITLQKLLFDFSAQHISHVAMEVSSHALAQGRINGTILNTGIFTNLTRDHLDYHGNMENYAQTKFKLFKHSGLQHGVLNADDPIGLEWINKLSAQLSVYAYGLQPHYHLPAAVPVIHAKHVQVNSQGMATALCTPWGEGMLHTNLIGQFNLSNLLAVITTLGIMQIPLPEILRIAAQLKSPPGRMQTFGGDGKHPLIVIDYAHTPDALSKALQTLRAHNTGKLWCVFGCGGDRDRGKRAEMGRIAETYADYLILTDDNPRTENPKQITADIIAGLHKQADFIVEHDRQRAIQHALSCAKPEDVVLIAGKGHEAYQQIGQKKLPFSDSLTVKRLLLEM